MPLKLRDDSDAKADQSWNSQVEVVIATDGDVDKIKAESLDKAVELIKQRIEAMAKESGGSDKHAAQIKALKQAIADLEKARATTVRVKVDAPEGTGRRRTCSRIYLRMSGRRGGSQAARGDRRSRSTRPGHASIP